MVLRGFDTIGDEHGTPSQCYNVAVSLWLPSMRLIG